MGRKGRGRASMWVVGKVEMEEEMEGNGRERYGVNKNVRREL